MSLFDKLSLVEDKICSLDKQMGENESKISELNKKMDLLSKMLTENSEISQKKANSILDLFSKNNEFLKILLANQLLDEMNIDTTVQNQTNETVPWATLQYPDYDLVISPNTSITFYGRVFVKGITDLNPGVSEKTIIKARFGLEDGFSESWHDADVNETTNPDFGNNNEYKYTHCFDKIGSFICTFKFSADEGKTWFFANNSLKVEVNYSCSEINFIDRGEYIELKKPIGNIRMIEKGCSNYMMDWNHAIEYAENLRKGGFTDWRVPTKEELQIIYKIKDVCGIGKVNAWWFWSSTNFACLSFSTGNWITDTSSAINSVRCVR